MVLKAHKIKLNPTSEQERYFWRASNIARFVFNWGLAEYNKRLEYNREVNRTGKGEKIKVSGRLLKKEFNKIKEPWVNEVTCWAYQGAFDDLQTAFRNYFDRQKKGLLKSPKNWKPRKDGKPFGWPRFKSKFKSVPAFYLANTALHFNGHSVQFDKGRVGWINMTETLRFNGKILGGRISYRSGYWWLSIQVETEHNSLKPNGDSVGVDLGIKYLAVTSDGIVYDNPKALQKAQCKLRRLQRKLDRQSRSNNPDNYNKNGTVKPGSREWHKSNRMLQTERQITKLHYRIACIRQDTSHKMTTEITRDYAIIGIEDLNINGMLKNGRLSKALHDAALYEKRRQLTYKTNWQGGIIIPVDRWFPSSKTCNNCGWINAELSLNDRQWTCRECKTVIHRDGNAALNIRDEALRILSPEYSPGDKKRSNGNASQRLDVVREP